jgi:hypothetical protein
MHGNIKVHTTVYLGSVKEKVYPEDPVIDGMAI